jgi:hypothetical protein
MFLAVFIAGGVGGALLDQIHVRAHVLRYAHPDLAGQAWWVAPQFGVAVVVILFACVSLGRRIMPSRDHVPIAVDATIFVVAYAVTGVLRTYAWAIAVILIVLWVGRLLVHRDRALLLTVSLGLAVVGPAYESLLTWTGAFHYTITPLALRVPIWLPLLYLIAGVLAASAARAVLNGDWPTLI